MDNAYEFVLSRKDVILRYVVAMPLLVPGAFLLTIQVLIVPGLISFFLEGPPPGEPDPSASILANIAFPLLTLSCWAVLLYWAVATDSIRRTIARACWAFSTGAFLMPISGIYNLFFGPPDLPETFFPKGFVMIVLFFIGMVFGLMMRGFAVATAPLGSEEKSGGTWYVFRSISHLSHRIGLVRTAVAVAFLVIGVVAVDIGGFLEKRYTAITTFDWHTCGVRTDGTAHCWGDFSAIPPPGERFVAVAPGSFRACGLREDGSVSCWRSFLQRSGYYPSPVPGEELGKGPFTEITAGDRHFCGLRTDGTVACWGDDQFGQGSPPDGERFTTISAGLNHTCGIRLDGTVACWGDDLYGQASPPDSEQFKAISSGGDYTCGIRLNGFILCWSNSTNSLSAGLSSPPGPFVALSSGRAHACGLRPGGSVYCWGDTHLPGAYGAGSEPVKHERFVAISSSHGYNCGLRQNGTVRCWGGHELHWQYM